MQDVTNPSIFYCMQDILLPLDYLILPYFSHDRSNWFPPSISSATFQNFPCISDLLFELSKIQHHTMRMHGLLMSTKKSETSPRVQYKHKTAKAKTLHSCAVIMF